MKGDEGLICTLLPLTPPINTGDFKEKMKGEGYLRNPIMKKQYVDIAP